MLQYPAEPKLPRWSAWYNARYSTYPSALAAAALLHYCAYSIGTHTRLLTPVVHPANASNDRVPNPQSRGLDPRS